MNRYRNAFANGHDSARWRAPLAVAGLIAFATLTSATALAADGLDAQIDCVEQAGVQGASLEECLAPAAGPLTSGATSRPTGGQSDHVERVANNDPDGPTGS
ncbi:MAG: hypothetical protein WEC41_08050, partial [Dongiaceae bacterium]